LRGSHGFVGERRCAGDQLLQTPILELVILVRDASLAARNQLSGDALELRLAVGGRPTLRRRVVLEHLVSPLGHVHPTVTSLKLATLSRWRRRLLERRLQRIAALQLPLDLLFTLQIRSWRRGSGGAVTDEDTEGENANSLHRGFRHRNQRVQPCYGREGQELDAGRAIFSPETSHRRLPTGVTQGAVRALSLERTQGAS